ncbi:DMT family transporter [Streptomyces sp. NP160]|uniref:DMT family transporter n=1 Tax=Streptomyces sp. NP160 TaxID=2586637 RepID=UPI0011180B04|nr:DMT family transporter [Streptomyces sp. NP160]TNM64122.1 DMT family transporter [Streptomyces sp. NP160]
MSARVLAVALVLFWSSGFIGAELGSSSTDAATVLAWRCLVPALLLAPLLPRRWRRWPAREWGRQVVLAVLCQGLYLAGIYWGAAAGVPAGTSALIGSLQTALVLVAVAVANRRPVSRRHVAGLAAGTAGVALTAVGDVGAGASLLALLLPVAAVLSLAAGTVLHERWGAGSTPTMPLAQSLALQCSVAAVLTSGAAAATGDLLPPPSAGFWVALAFAVVAGLGSYACYYRAIDVLGADRTNALLYLTPAVTAVWAAAVFGDDLRVTTVLGLALSGAGAALLLQLGSLRPEVRRAPVAPPPDGLR